MNISMLMIKHQQVSICNIQLKAQEIVNTNNMQDAICNMQFNKQYPISN